MCDWGFDTHLVQFRQRVYHLVGTVLWPYAQDEIHIHQMKHSISSFYVTISIGLIRNPNALAQIQSICLNLPLHLSLVSSPYEWIILEGMLKLHTINQSWSNWASADRDGALSRFRIHIKNQYQKENHLMEIHKKNIVEFTLVYCTISEIDDEWICAYALSSTQRSPYWCSTGLVLKGLI